MLWLDAISSSSTSAGRGTAVYGPDPPAPQLRHHGSGEMSFQEFQRQALQHPVFAVQRAERHLQRFGRELDSAAG